MGQGQVAAQDGGDCNCTWGGRTGFIEMLAFEQNGQKVQDAKHRAAGEEACQEGPLVSLVRNAQAGLSCSRNHDNTHNSQFLFPELRGL